MKRSPSNPARFIVPAVLAGVVLCIQSTFGAGSIQGIQSVAYTARSARAGEPIEFDLAKLQAHARVVYVSSGAKASAFRMIDNDPHTVFRFAGSDPHPTVIIELERSRQLHRVSAVYETGGGQVEVYLLSKLSENPGDLREAKPLTSIVDVIEGEGGEATVSFEVTRARYLALRWIPDKPGPFEVAEVSAFGTVPFSVFYLESVPTASAQPLTAQVPDLPSIPIVSP